MHPPSLSQVTSFPNGISHFSNVAKPAITFPSPVIPKDALQVLVSMETLELLLCVIPTQEILFEWPLVFAG